MTYRIFAINPGSTSTKIALYEGDWALVRRTIVHDEAALAAFEQIPDQLNFRIEAILRALDEAGEALTGIDAYASRVSGLVGCASGVYQVNERMLQHARIGYTIMHPASLGCQIAAAFAERFGGRALVVDPPESDELDEPARMTGLKGVYRESHLHVLNQKEVARRYAASVGKRYEDIDLVVAHLGGGITVGAHRRGRIVDATDGVQGDGPLSPTRSDSLPALHVIHLCMRADADARQLADRVSSRGGWLDHVGTSDLRKLIERMDAGDAQARRVYEATVRQVVKHIGAYAAVLEGRAEAILLTGGLARSERLAGDIGRHVGFLAKVKVYPGEFEMEALAAGARRVLDGEEAALEYSGVPVWSPPA